MPTRRELLLACASLALPVDSALALDRADASRRYRLWLVQLSDDLARMAADVGASGSLTPAQVEQYCGNSIVPKSRGAALLVQLSERASPRRRSHRQANRYLDHTAIMLALLHSSVPAGDGGGFPENPGSRFAAIDSRVWYMHVDGGEKLHGYFADQRRFPHYLLPPSGTLERQAYPFLLFDDGHESIRLAGVSEEWMGAVVALYNNQFS